MSIKIVADSTCDLLDSVIKELGITIVPLYINIGDKGFADGIDLSREDFYKNLSTYAEYPSTATPGTLAFTEAFEQLAASGAQSIISIHISESLSATIDVARTAAEQFTKIPVSVWDSGQLSLGTGFQVELAARMAKNNKSVDEILEALKDLGDRTFVAAGLESLEFLRRSGRMNRYMTGLGSLLQIKPILTMSAGEPGSERVRTMRKAQKRLGEMLQEHKPIEKLGMLHTNASAKAKSFIEKIDGLPSKQEIYSVNITPVIGAHVGPGAIGFAVVQGK